MHLSKNRKKKCRQKNNRTRKQCLFIGKTNKQTNKKYHPSYLGESCFFKNTSPPGTVMTDSAGEKKLSAFVIFYSPSSDQPLSC